MRNIRLYIPGGFPSDPGVVSPVLFITQLEGVGGHLKERSGTAASAPCSSQGLHEPPWLRGPDPGRASLRGTG